MPIVKFNNLINTLRPLVMNCLSLLCTFYTPSLFGQIKNFIQHNSEPISAISPDSTDYDDLEVIGNSVNDAQIVMMGEQDHGDAATFLAKTRLIKYLHEKKGFQVLAFESDFFGLNEGFEKIDKDSTKISLFLRDNILSLWSYCTACNDLLFTYIPSTYKSKSPLFITGFDNQMDYTYSRKYLVQKLDSVLQSLHLKVTQQPNYESEILPAVNALVTRYWYQRPPDDSFALCNNYLTTVRDQLKEQLPADDFWKRVVDNLIALDNELLHLKSDKWTSENIRDHQMFLNLQWLARVKYPGQKIIVWAANNHVAKYRDKNYTSMGYYLAADSTGGIKSYSIAFTSYTGEAGRINQSRSEIEAPKNSCLESWIDPSYKYAFVDYTAFNRLFPNSTETFTMRQWRYWSSRNKWTRIFDGVFYIKDMFPCNDH